MGTEKSITIFGRELEVGIKQVFDDEVVRFYDAADPNLFFFSLNEKMLSRHLLMLGGAGSGKTNVFKLMLNQLRDNGIRDTSNDVFLIFDTKGDYEQQFRMDGDYVLGNGKAYREISESWNIFDEVLADGWDPDDYEVNAKELANGLFEGRGSSAQPFFVNAAKDIFAHIVIHFIRQHLEHPNEFGFQELNNRHLVSFILKAEIGTYESIFKHHEDMKGMLSYLGDGSSNQALGVFAELKGMIYDCFLGVFRSDASKGRFSIRNTIREKGGKAIFIEYDLTTGETMTPIYRMMVDFALKEALGRNDGEDGNVYLILDELKLLPKLQHLDDALNFGRSKGVKVIAGIQSINQLYDIYGEAKGHVLAGGFGSLFAFYTSDAASRRYVSELFGENVIGYEYTGLDGKDKHCEREGYAVESWDQMQLQPGDAIIGLVDIVEPFFFKFQFVG